MEGQVMTEPKIDEENPEWTEADFARARPAPDVLSAEVLDAFKRGRGRPKAEAPKIPVKVRLDQDVLAALRASGAGWQTRVNAFLRKDLGLGAEPEPAPDEKKRRA
jgi:uncharacterized protein (DUF4415 family)